MTRSDTAQLSVPKQRQSHRAANGFNHLQQAVGVLLAITPGQPGSKDGTGRLADGNSRR